MSTSDTLPPNELNFSRMNVQLLSPAQIQRYAESVASTAGPNKEKTLRIYQQYFSPDFPDDPVEVYGLVQNNSSHILSAVTVSKTDALIRTGASDIKTCKVALLHILDTPEEFRGQGFARKLVTDLEAILNVKAVLTTSEIDKEWYENIGYSFTPDSANSKASWSTRSNELKDLQDKSDCTPALLQLRNLGSVTRLMENQTFYEFEKCSVAENETVIAPLPSEGKLMRTLLGGENSLETDSIVGFTLYPKGQKRQSSNDTWVLFRHLGMKASSEGDQTEHVEILFCQNLTEERLPLALRVMKDLGADSDYDQVWTLRGDTPSLPDSWVTKYNATKSTCDGDLPLLTKMPGSEGSLKLFGLGDFSYIS